MKKILIIIGVIIAVSIVGYKGFYFYTKRASPETMASFEKNNLSIQVKYNQPSKKGRVIFGELVRYDEIWRTGANESTEISFAKDVMVAGKNLKAGTYSLFTIPSKTKWTIIFNSTLGGWGHYSYDTAKDVLRVEVPATETSEVTEKFAINFEETATGAAMLLAWDKTKVVVPIDAPL